MDTKVIITFFIVIAIIGIIAGGITYLIKNAKRLIRKKIDRVSRELIGISANDVKNIVSTINTLSDVAEETVTPKSVGGATNIYLKQIERDFPDFHNYDAESAVKTFVSEYLMIQYEGKKDFENANVDNGIVNLIEKSPQIKDVQNVTFNKIAIAGYKKSDEYATINYQCSVGFNIDNRRVETRFKMNYTLRLAQDNVATKAMICPNCGATIESTSETNCPYCDTKIIRDTILNWLFSSIVEE